MRVMVVFTQSYRDIAPGGSAVVKVAVAVDARIGCLSPDNDGGLPVDSVSHLHTARHRCLLTKHNTGYSRRTSQCCFGRVYRDTGVITQLDNRA